MNRVYVCKKKDEMLKILEADPYGDDSFARIGYKIKEGSVIEEDKNLTYLYLSASQDFIKKADELLKEVAEPASKEVEEKISKKIEKEEKEAESGFGSIFG